MSDEDMTMTIDDILDRLIASGVISPEDLLDLFGEYLPEFFREAADHNPFAGRFPSHDENIHELVTNLLRSAYERKN